MPQMIQTGSLLKSSNQSASQSFSQSFSQSIGYFYSTSSGPLILRGIPEYSIDTVSELTRQSATGNYEWTIWTCDLPYSRHRTYHWATIPIS